MGRRGCVSCKKAAVLWTVLWAVAVAGPSVAHAAMYSGGSGTSGNPYLISTVQDLLELADIDNSADWAHRVLRYRNA